MRSYRSSFNGISTFLLLGAAVFSLSLYHIGLGKDGAGLGLLIITSSVFHAVALAQSTANIIWFIRTMFLSVFGLMPATAVYMGGLFDLHLQFTQTSEVASIMLMMSSVALFSSRVGFRIAEKSYVRENQTITVHSYATVLFVFFLVLAVSYLIGLMRGEMVLFTQYRIGQAGVDMPIKNLNVIARFLVFTLLFYYFAAKERGGRNVNLYRNYFIFAALYLMIWNEVLRGARMDPLTEIISIWILLSIYKGKSLSLNAKKIAALGLLFFVVQSWGYLRYGLVSGIELEQLVGYVTRPFDVDDQAVLFKQGTINNLAASISGTIYAINNNLLEYKLGGTYFDYILRTPPRFIYPDRPDSLALLLNKPFGTTTGGGYTELAEVYLNFGIYGALIIPGLISFIIGYSMKLFVRNKYSFGYAVLFFGLLSVYFRGNLYQTFAFYKASVTAVILFAVIYLFDVLIKSAAYKRSRYPNHTANS